MELSSISRRDAASRIRFGFTLSVAAVSVMLWVSGCNQPDSDVAGVDATVDAVAELDSDDLVAANSKAGATVPNDPAGSAPAPAPSKLAVGDPSPGLQIAKWVKGDPVQAPLKDKVHVVEFWATWCGPCRAGMPHISQLQSEYGDEVAFIGVTRENEGTVNSFLAKNAPDGRTWDEVITYRLALDDNDWTNTAYMRAANQNGIPCAFVVGRDGTVEWIGHPGSIDAPLKQIVEGSWDREAMLAQQKQQQRLQQAGAQLARFQRAGDWDSALELLAELEQDLGKSAMLLNARLQILESAGRSDEASKARGELIEAAWDDATALNDLAWTIATNGESVDLELALKAAERASKLRDDKDPAVLDTLARCHYEMGNLDEAIRWQRLAAKHNTGFAEVETTLKRYLKEKGEDGDSQEEASDDSEPADADAA